MKKVIMLLLVGLVFVSCEKEISGPHISAGVSFSIVSFSGDDLLSSTAVEAITEGNTAIFVLKNGQKIRLYEGNLDAPKFFKIRSQDGRNVFHMFFDLAPESFNDNKITQYIRFKDGSEVEVVGEFNPDRKKNKILQKVWVNGVEKTKIETSNSAQSPIVIVR